MNDSHNNDNTSETLAAEQTVLPPDEAADDDLLTQCREKICPACTIAAEASEIRLRALAEMENFKKRLQREKDEQARYVAGNVLADILPTLDNLDLALQYGTQAEACKDILTGVELTRKLLLDAMKNHGLELVGAAGEDFDPEKHEAIGREENPDAAPGSVLKIMLKGYKLRDRLLRPAKVIVNSVTRLDRTV